MNRWNQVLALALVVGCAACAEEPEERETTPPPGEESPTPPGQAPGPADLDGDGFDETEDCDDLYAGVFPGAPERCDGVDNDCDGQIDEDAEDALTGYPDADGDGFGDDAAPLVACVLPDDHVQVGGDCDDADSDRHPGRAELCDGIDNDCEPMTTEAGVVSSGGVAYATVQAALDGAGDGAVITLCDGEYHENLVVPPVGALTLVSQNGPEATILDGDQLGTVLTGGADVLVLEGLAIRNGYGDHWDASGGGVSFHGGMVTITDCHFVDNVQRAGDGGALSLRDTDATITDSEFIGNEGYNGGAIWAYNTRVIITDSLFEGNSAAWEGGGIMIPNNWGSLAQPGLQLERTDFVGNTATLGGATSHEDAAVIIDGSFIGNVVSFDGGAVLSRGTLTSTGTTFEGNRARAGGALALWGAATLDGVAIVGNHATDVGGGLVAQANVDIVGSVVLENGARDGGGAASEDWGGGRLSSTDTDWGTGPTDNDPDDLYIESGDVSYTANGDFACELSMGVCQ